MAEQFQLPIPMWRVQLQLLGGHRRLIAILVITPMVIAAATYGITRILPKEPFPDIARWVLNTITGIQAAALLLGGCNAIYRALLRDSQTKMIESHRLAPMSNWGVVLGYLFGSTIQILALYVLFCVVGVVLCALAGKAIGTTTESWLQGNLVLLSGAVTLWSAALLIGMRQDKPISCSPILIGIGALTAPLAMVPVTGLLACLYSVLLSVWVITGQVAVAAPALVIVVIANSAMTVFWLSSAAGKYRRPDLPAFNGVRGLALLMLTVIAGAGGLTAYAKIASARMPGFWDPGLLVIQWIATLLFCLIVALVAIAGAVKCHVLGEQGIALRNNRDRMSPVLTAIAAVLIIVGGMQFLGRAVWEDLGALGRGAIEQDSELLYAWGWSGAAIFLGALTICFLLGFLFRAMKSPRFFIFLFMLLAWALPPIGDAMRAEMTRDFKEPLTYSWAFGASPAGTIIAAWTDLRIEHWPGLAIQSGILLFLITMERRVRRRNR